MGKAFSRLQQSDLKMNPLHADVSLVIFDSHASYRDVDLRPIKIDRWKIPATKCHFEAEAERDPRSRVCYPGFKLYLPHPTTTYLLAVTGQSNSSFLLPILGIQDSSNHSTHT
jgi:hypothetical protein